MCLDMPAQARLSVRWSGERGGGPGVQGGRPQPRGPRHHQEEHRVRRHQVQLQSKARQREGVPSKLNIPFMVDPHHIDADPDQTFLLMDPDPTSHLHADPDSGSCFSLR